MSTESEETTVATDNAEAGGSRGTSQLELQMSKMFKEMKRTRDEFRVRQDTTASKLARGTGHDPYSFRQKGTRTDIGYAKMWRSKWKLPLPAFPCAEKGAGKEALARAKDIVKTGITGAGV